MRAGDRVGGRFVLRAEPDEGGGKDEVWLAYDERLRREVVLKRLTDLPPGEPWGIATINHTHVVTVYEYLPIEGDRADAGDWLVMEYAPHGSLATKPKLPPEQAARYGAQIASALIDVHARGFVHCDVKPANIVLGDNDIAKLADFGAAYQADSEDTLTPQYRISYTPAYAAPEVVAGRPVRASDVYSLATTVYALVVGESPHLPGHEEQDPELGPLADVLAMMRHRKPKDRPDAARAQRMFEDIANGRASSPRQWSATTVRPDPDVGLLPAQLPPDVSGFAGRDDELGRLHAVLADTSIATISGTAGVGKTTLAVHWAHRIAEQFPDGQLYVSLRGFGPAEQVMPPGTALRGFLEAYDVPPEKIPSDLDAQTALYRSRLAGKRVLVVLDDARDSDHVRPLLPGAPGCLVIVTSRDNLAGLVTREAARPVQLGLLPATEARDLLVRRIGPERSAAEPDAIDGLVDACARLPLALAIVAARAATQPRFPLDALVAELRDSGTQLDRLTAGGPDTDVRTVFSWSYDLLTPEAARLFRLLGPHPGPHITMSAAASLAGLQRRQIRSLLTELTRSHLISEHAPGRYWFHDLLRAYATELTNELDTEAERRAATQRLLDHYLHTAVPASMVLDSAQTPPDLPPPAVGVSVDELPVFDEALAWFEAEVQVLVGAREYAAGNGFDTHAWKLAWSTANLFDRQARPRDRIAAWQTGLAALERLGDRAGQARAHRNLANSYTKIGEYDSARGELRHALGLLSDLDERQSLAHTHRVLGVLYTQQGQHAEALQEASIALEIYQTIDDGNGQASALNEIGWFHLQLGEYEQTLAHCTRALELLRELDNPTIEAATLDTIGYAHHHLEQYQQAIVRYREALDVLASSPQQDDEAAILEHLGDSQLALDDRGSARKSWERAAAILDELGHTSADAIHHKLRGLDQPR